MKSKRPVLVSAALDSFVRRGVAAQKAANEQMHLVWSCPRCEVLNAGERSKCVHCGQVKP